MIKQPDRDTTLAFAGVFQSAALVYQIAKRGNYDVGAMQQSGYSLIRLDADNIEDIYSSVFGVDLGLRTIIKLFSEKPDVSSRDIFQYAISVHQLSIKLKKLAKTSEIIHKELEIIQSQYPDLTDNLDQISNDDELHASLAKLYSRTISYLTPKIMVQGSPERLQQPQTVNRVRTALFAGIRSAYLWEQLGGRRWHLVLNRKAYVGVAKFLLKTPGTI